MSISLNDDAARQEWNQAAETFDHEPDHGLHDPAVRAAWAALLKTSLPASPGIALDIGCGTGSLSLILAEQGWAVTGIDFAPAMIARAEAKAHEAGHAIRFQVMDGADPQFPVGYFDALVCRHVLWALPDPDQVLRRWADLLKPGGRLLLIEGCWHTGAGLHAAEIVAALPPGLSDPVVQPLSDQPDLWGGPVTDKRYAIRVDRQGEG